MIAPYWIGALLLLTGVARAGTPANAVVVGFPGERVPVFGRDPNNGDAYSGTVIQPIATVPMGISVKADPDPNAGGWTHFVADSPEVPREGYIAASRLNFSDRKDMTFPPPPASPDTRLGKPAPAICVSVARALDSPEKLTRWPDKQVDNTTIPQDIVDAIAPRENMQVFEARIGTQTLEVLDVDMSSFGEIYQLHSFVSLWTTGFTKRITRQYNGEETAERGVFSVSGRPIFTQAQALSNETEVMTFGPHLELQPVCTVGVRRYEHEERVESATEPAVCVAATKGAISNIPFSAIDTYESTKKEFLDITADADGGSGPYQFNVVGVANVDLDNTGARQRIGWAVWDPLGNRMYPNPGHFEWPVLLTAEGKLSPDSAWSAQAFALTQPNSMARLFRFNGATYLEYHWGPGAEEHTHEIWHLTSKGQKRACKFTTGQSSGHEVVRVNN